MWSVGAGFGKSRIIYATAMSTKCLKDSLKYVLVIFIDASIK
jgi:hypothetical protein